MAHNPEDGSGSPEVDAEDDSDNMAEDKGDHASSEEKSPSRGGNENSSSKPAAKSNAKDPSRPRRKKARRACFACQRAHLTCGDERPCLRCIKRGLQDQCHDGVRKKAKYLHDAPAEALMPGFPGNYHMNGAHPMQNVTGAPQMGSHGVPASQPGTFYHPATANAFNQYNQLGHQGQMPPQMMQNASMDYSSQPTVDPATQFQAPTSQISPVQTMASTMDQSSVLGSAGSASFDPAFIDPNDPSLFNFNISDLNFGNRYGAMEFGMLGQMSSGAVNTPDDGLPSMGRSSQGNVSYEGLASNFGYDQAFQPWQNVPSFGVRQSSSQHLWTLNNNAFAVGENSTSGAGDQQGTDFNVGYSSGTVSPELRFAQPDGDQQHDGSRDNSSNSRTQKRKRVPFPNDVGQTNTSKRHRRDTADIYAAVQSPYPYTQGFHNLTAFLHKRFPTDKVYRIAKALASIRPSFISCNKNLNNDDLIFMEKCFQRTLYEYDEFLSFYGTPSIILRRTGEIAHVSKEFCLVTGWRESVVLGKEPNLNVNTNANRSGSQTGSTSKGTATPRTPAANAEPGRPQPVLLPELLDEDSVVQFFEDFAELAFGASRSSIIGAPCYLMKYKTKNDPGWRPKDRQADDDKSVKKQNEVKNENESLIKGEAGMNTLGEDDGRVKAVMCWTVKRDVFDIPMMVIINFLPVI